MGIAIDNVNETLENVPAVDTVDFQRAMQLMEDARSDSAQQLSNQTLALDLEEKRITVELEDTPIVRGVKAIGQYCANKFNVPADSDDECMEQLFHGLAMRVLSWGSFLRANLELLRSRDLARGDSYLELLDDIAAYLPLHPEKGGYDPEEVIAEADSRLGREHVPVVIPPSIPEEKPSAKTLKSLEKAGFIKIKSEVRWGGFQKQMEEFLEMFAVVRTIAARVDPVTQTATIADDELTREVNDWIFKNPVFTKEDLKCMKSLLRKLGIPKFVWQNLVRSMRGKNFAELCETLFPQGEGS